MIDDEELCANPETGRTVWFLRHIPVGVFGDAWDWGVIVIKPSSTSRTAFLVGMQSHMGRFGGKDKLKAKLNQMGFIRARWKHRGRWKTYK